jgi:energy-coupling factor transporter transmembrane protein EcfT
MATYILAFLGIVLLYFTARGLVFYQTFFSISKRAFYMAKIAPEKRNFLGSIVSFLIMIFTAPIIGITLFNADALDKIMRGSLLNVANRFSDRQNASNFTEKAMELWEKDFEKEKV